MVEIKYQIIFFVKHALLNKLINNLAEYIEQTKDQSYFLIASCYKLLEV